MPSSLSPSVVPAVKKGCFTKMISLTNIERRAVQEGDTLVPGLILTANADKQQYLASRVPIAGREKSRTYPWVCTTTLPSHLGTLTNNPTRLGTPCLSPRRSCRTATAGSGEQHCQPKRVWPFMLSKANSTLELKMSDSVFYSKLH